MKKIVVINGFHTGKDTFVKYAGEFADVVNYSYVDFTRNMYLENGIDTNNKTDKLRILLAGTNKLLEQFDDIPFKDICSVTDDFLNNDLEGDILFMHIREPKIIKKFVAKYENAKSLLVKRDTDIEAPTAEDANVEDYCYDYIIQNNSTMNNLKEKAETFTLSLYAEDV
jgi:hypothetical protein